MSTLAALHRVRYCVLLDLTLLSVVAAATTNVDHAAMDD